MNSGLVHSELNFNWRRFCKTVSKSANWGFDRFRIYGNSWSTRIQVRRPDGSVVDTQYFNSNYQFEHDFSFDLSENVNNEEYSVYIAGVPASAKISQVYAFPTGFGATTGKNAEISYWDLAQVSPAPDGAGQIGRLRLENNPVTQIDGAANIQAGEIRFTNCQLGAENLADLLIGSDNYGNSNGTFNYSGNSAAPAGRALAAYNNLKDVKAWAMTGAIPVDAPAYEAETTAFMNAIAIPDDANPSIYDGVSNNDVWLTVDEYIRDLKTANIYSKLFYNYLRIGSTALSQGTDLIDPSRIGTYLGSWVFGKEGAKANGVNCYFKAIANPLTLSPTSNDFGMSYVINVQTLGSDNYTANGIYSNNAGGLRIQMYTLWAVLNKVGAYMGSIIGSSNGSAFPSAAFHTTNRSADLGKYYSNGLEKLSNSQGSTTFPNAEMYEGASNWFETSAIKNFIQGDLGVSAYHKNLTASETLALSNAVDKLETALGRKRY